MTYATLAGPITLPGSDTGVQARVYAIPRTKTGMLTYTGDDRLTIGPVIGTSDASGDLGDTLKVPTNVAFEVYWTIVVKPINPPPGVPKQWTVKRAATISGTGTVKLRDLAEITVTAVSTSIVENVAALLASTQAAKIAAEEAQADAEAARDDLLSQKGAADGLAPLDADGKWDEDYAPERLTEAGLSASTEAAIETRQVPHLAGAVGAHLTTTHARNDSTTVMTMGKDEATGKLYGVLLSNTHFVTSTDGITWTDQTAAAFTYWTNKSQCMYFTTSWMYHTTTDGRIFRAPKDNFTGWVDISAPVPATTTGRAGIFVAYDSGVLLYANYDQTPAPDTPGSGVWRSTNNGSTWTNPLWLPHPQSRHSHAVRADPWHPGDVYFMAGDDPGTGATWLAAGLYKSSDYGVTWTAIQTVGDRQAAGLDVGRIGIDMVFPEPVPGLPEMILIEGDVTGTGPHLFVHYKGSDTVEPLIWYTGALADTECTVATTRGIALTPYGDCIYFTTTEGGVAGRLAGIYVAKAPLFFDAVLLEDITGAEPVGYLQTVCSPTEVHMRGIRFNIPKFSH